jgi:hypothetical protein
VVTSSESHPMATAPATSVSRRSPTTKGFAARVRSAAASNRGRAGLPTMTGVAPVAVVTAARMEPAPGHRPSGAG